MTDFTSSLYLGMKHSSAELKSWQQLTTGVPAALCEHELSKKIGKYVANMQGLEDGICATSTLHLYWDLFGLLSGEQIVLFIDDKIYPVSKYGIEKLQCSSTPIHKYKHLDAVDLLSVIKSNLPKHKRPVVLCDGWCPLCGKHSPINEYAKIVQPYKGIVVIDDTQAFGVLGRKKTKAMPFGKGGGGILQWLNMQQEANVVTIISLAKGFGVPMAVISGNAAFITTFEKNSTTRVSSSPVSIAHLHAAENAFSKNNEDGEQRRALLWRNVVLLKAALNGTGVKLQGGIFPVQSIHAPDATKTKHLAKKLKEEDIKSVLIKQHDEQKPALALLIRCDHKQSDINKVSYYIQKYYCSLPKTHVSYGKLIW